MFNAQVRAFCLCVFSVLVVLPCNDLFAGGSSRQALLEIQAREREIERQRAIILEQQQRVTQSEQAVQQVNEIEARRQQLLAEQTREQTRLRRIYDANRERATQIRWTRQRCSENQDADIATPEQAEGRTRWAVKCLNERATSTTASNIDKELASFYVTLITGFGRSTTATGRYLYPTFGRIEYVEVNEHSLEIRELPPNHAAFPTDPNAGCESLEGHSLVGFCEAGCFARDQMILFPTGYEAISLAQSNHSAVAVTLAPGAFIGALEFKDTAVDHYTMSPQDKWQELVELQTASGKHLKVTKNHPLLLATGIMIKAEQLQPGQALLTQDGSEDLIIDLHRSNYFGKVYNLRMASDLLEENIVVAQGLLSGSSYYQNEGIEYLNRMVLRAHLPSDLVNSEI